MCLLTVREYGVNDKVLYFLFFRAIVLQEILLVGSQRELVTESRFSSMRNFVDCQDLNLRPRRALLQEILDYHSDQAILKVLP